MQILIGKYDFVELFKAILLGYIMSFVIDNNRHNNMR